MKLWPRLSRILFCMALLLLAAVPGMASDRIALVIGNAKYSAAPDLRNPYNDARAIAGELRRIGFEVMHLEDTTRAALTEALKEFRHASFGKRQAVVYYAGHGIEIDKQNYLVPTDATLRTDIDAAYEAVRMDLVLESTAGASELRLVVLDACRDNPFIENMARADSTRSLGRGLADIEPTTNTLVAYSAKGGTVALDGRGDMSPYATAFLKALRTPGLEIGKFFRQVRDDVLAATATRQEPFLYGSLSARDIFLSPVNEAPAPAAAPAATPAADSALDLAFWQSAEASGNAGDYRDYIDRFPNGTFRSMAERRLAALDTAERGVTILEPDGSSVPIRPAPDDSPITRSELREMQERLNVLDLDAGPEDGLIGPRTRTAILNFEKSAGLIADGDPDRTMLSRLASAVPEADLAAYRSSKAAAARVTASAPNPLSGMSGKWCLCATYFHMRTEDNRVFIRNQAGLSYYEDIVVTGPSTWTSAGVPITRLDANTMRADRLLCPMMRRC
ncbi:MAG: caspase family protein [Pseudomonadota bacterium]